LTSLCSVYLRYAPIRSGCGGSSSPRLATKQDEKFGLDRFSRSGLVAPERPAVITINNIGGAITIDFNGTEPE
jgi:hypothetical protein